MTTFPHDCPYCRVKYVGFVVRHVEPIYEEINKNTEYHCAFATCNHCGNGIVAKRLGKLQAQLSSPVSISLDIYSEWLPKIELPNIPAHCPEDVANAFKEAIDTLETSLSGACGLFRKAIDLATKNISEYDVHKLEKRIRLLVKNQLITPAMADWAEQIRLDANFSLHESKPTREQATDLLWFTKFFLLYLFTFPKKVELARSRRPTT